MGALSGRSVRLAGLFSPKARRSFHSGLLDGGAAPRKLRRVALRSALSAGTSFGEVARQACKTGSAISSSISSGCSFLQEQNKRKWNQEVAHLRQLGQKCALATIVAARWIPSVQNGDGGWGESCASYLYNQLRSGQEHGLADGVGDSRSAAAGEGNSPAFERGVSYLLDTQTADGEY